MNKKAKRKIPAVPNTLRSLRRAAKGALAVARKMDAPFYVMEGNKIVNLAARTPAPRKSAARKKRTPRRKP